MPRFTICFTIVVFAVFSAGFKPAAFAQELLFYQTLDRQAAPVLSPDQALAAFTVAPGFEVELVAAEPLVEDPVAMAWDEFGRLYAVEMRGFMPDAYGAGSDSPVGQVVRLEDTNGDGRMDSSEVFLDQLVNPRAVAVVNEGVLIGEPPNLWLCELPQRSSRCVNKRRVGDYAPQVAEGNVEHLENGLLPGLDNWLYNSKSARSLRLSAEGLQEREGLPRGQWGIAKDNVGRLFYNHNSTWLQADLFAAEDLVLPGDTSYPPGLGVNLTPLSEVFSVRVNPGVNRAYLDGTLREDGRLHKATAASGLMVYRGDQFPQQYHQDVFVPEPAGNVVARFSLQEQGMNLTAKHRLYPDPRWGQREFLASTDERFRPVDATNGPDGALYIIDMYRGIVQDNHYLTDELRAQIFQRRLDTPIGMGRIWRIRHTDGKAQQKMPALADASGDELVTLLEHENGWLRDTAQRLLIKQENDVRSALVQLSVGNNTLAAIHAIWTLSGRGELQRELVLRVATKNDPQRQLQVLRAGRHLLLESDMSTLHSALASASEVLRMQLAFSMGDHIASAEVRGLLRQILDNGLHSSYVRQAVVRAARGQELVFLEELLLSGSLGVQSTETEHVLATLAANSYRSLCGDLGCEAAANPALFKLLEIVQSRGGAANWQQISMLEGLAKLSSASGFRPAKMLSAPPLFVADSADSGDALWDARLAARRAFTWPGDEFALGLIPLSPRERQLLEKGEAFYATCGACHGEAGGGTPGLAPALAGASWVTGPPEWLGRIILQGMSGPVVVNDETWNGVMPPHQHLAELDDETLAGLMTYLRRSWGNTAGSVSTQDAAAIRAASAQRTKPWTASELELVAYQSALTRFTGTFAMSFAKVTIAEAPDGLYLSSEALNGQGLMTQISDTVFTANAAGGESRVEFILEEDGAVDTLIMQLRGQQVPFSRQKN